MMRSILYFVGTTAPLGPATTTTLNNTASLQAVGATVAVFVLGMLCAALLWRRRRRRQSTAWMQRQLYSVPETSISMTLNPAYMGQNQLYLQRNSLGDTYNICNASIAGMPATEDYAKLDLRDENGVSGLCYAKLDQSTARNSSSSIIYCVPEVTSLEGNQNTNSDTAYGWINGVVPATDNCETLTDVSEGRYYQIPFLNTLEETYAIPVEAVSTPNDECVQQGSSYGYITVITTPAVPDEV